MEAAGYLISVVVVAVATGFALWPPRGAGRLGTAAFLIGFPAFELPFLLVVWLLANTVLAWGQLVSPTGMAGLGLTVLTVVGLGVLVARSAATQSVLDQALMRELNLAASAERGRRPWRGPARRRALAHALLTPFIRRRRDVERVAELSYGDAGRSHRLDLYRHRSHPQHAPVFVHLHGGRFVSGAKSRESLPLLYHLAASGWIVLSANYRLSPNASFPDAHIDAKRVLTWAREHVAEYGGNPQQIVIAGNSAGAHLALFAALTPNEQAYQPDGTQVDTSVLAAVGLGGYYGRLDSNRAESSPAAHLTAAGPALLLLHGERDSVVPVAWARRFAADARAVCRQPVVYAELPGAQHNLDFFFSLRAQAVIDCVAAFTDWARDHAASPPPPPPKAASGPV